MLAAAFSAPGAPAASVALCADILRMQPHVSPAWACQFADELDYYAGADARLSLAIAMQESGLRMGVVSSTGDVGLFQVSPGTIRHYRLDRKRLSTDRQYAIRSHLLILADKRRMCPGPKGWSCYHSTTRKYRLAYEKQVGRYLRGIK
jgi:hypothetical protein